MYIDRNADDFTCFYLVNITHMATARAMALKAGSSREDFSQALKSKISNFALEIAPPVMCPGHNLGIHTSVQVSFIRKPLDDLLAAGTRLRSKHLLALFRPVLALKFQV